MTTFLKPKNLILVALILLISGCGVTTPEEESERQKVLVELTRIEQTIVPNDVRITGVVEPFEVSHIGAPTPSRIEKIYVDVGDRVEKGQLLVQMDRTQLFQAQVQLDNIREDLRRMDTLLRVGAVTQQQYDQLKTQYEVASSNVQNLEENTQIRANIPGMITGRFNSDGEIFSMAPATPGGRPAIVTLKQIQPVKIMVGLSERFFPEVKPGMEASITLDIFPGRAFTGRVKRIHPTIDRMSGTFQVEVLIENRDLTLRPGMFARVSLKLGEMEGLLVPSLAVRKQVGSDERFVFIVEDDKAYRRTVTLGRTFDDQLEILSGISTGEMIVVTGQHNLVDGSEVEIVNIKSNIIN